MKYIITERQFRLLNEEDIEEPVVPKKIKKIHYEFFDNNWDKLQDYLNRNEIRKKTPYVLIGDVDFGRRDDIKTLGSLVGVEGDLDLNYCRNITDLGELQFVKGDLRLQGCTKIKNLGNLESVGGNLDIPYTKITSLRNVKSVGKNLEIESSDVESLGKLEYVGKNIYWGGSALSKRATKDEIFNIPNLIIGGGIYN